MAQIKGLDSFFDVLEVIKDPDKYKAKLQEIKQVVDNYKVVVEAVVELAKVNEYTTSIRQREQQTQEILNKAERDVANIIVNAQTEANKIKSDAIAEKQVISDESREVKELKKQLKEQLQISKDEFTKLEKERQELRTRSMEVEAQSIELSSRLEKLKSVMQ